MACLRICVCPWRDDKAISLAATSPDSGDSSVYLETRLPISTAFSELFWDVLPEFLHSEKLTKRENLRREHAFADKNSRFRDPLLHSNRLECRI